MPNKTWSRAVFGISDFAFFCEEQAMPNAKGI